MSDKMSARDAKDYFGLPDIYGYPKKLVIVPHLADVYAMRNNFEFSDMGKSDNHHGVRICKGNYEKTPMSVMVCGSDPAIAATSMHCAAPLQFKQAVYFGPTRAVFDQVETGQVILPKSVGRYHRSAGFAGGLKTGKPNGNIFEALRHELESEFANMHHVGEAHTLPNPSARCPEGNISRESLMNQGYLCLDDKLFIILDIAKMNRMKAAGLLYVEGAVLDDGPSSDDMITLDQWRYRQLVKILVDEMPEGTSIDFQNPVEVNEIIESLPPYVRRMLDEIGYLDDGTGDPQPDEDDDPYEFSLPEIVERDESQASQRAVESLDKAYQVAFRALKNARP